jgi:hypothetical protein
MDLLERRATMSWTLTGTPRTQKAARRLAEEFATMEPAPHDRPLSERRLAVYERLMIAGHFRPITWAATLCKETGGTYRVNGKHTATLLSTLEPLPDLYITVERYECDTLDDVGRLYATFDSKMQARQASDIYHSFAGCVPELRDVPRRVINLSVAGMAWHLAGGRPDGTAAYAQPVDRAELLLEHPPFVLWLAARYGAGSVSVHQHLKRAAVVAAMFATWLKKSDRATHFWEEVRDETGHPPSVPTRKLARYLVLNFGKGKRTQGERISDKEVYVKCLRGWNAWRGDEPTDLRFSAKDPLPAVR